MARGGRRTNAKEPAPGRRRWAFEAQLFGGPGNGITIELDEFEPRVTVFRNGGPPFVVPGNVDASEHPDSTRIGVYELAGPIGPEMPIYVATKL